MLNVMSKILHQIQRTCEKKRKLQLIIIIQFYFSQTKCVSMQIQIKEKALIKYLNETIFKNWFRLWSLVFVHLFLRK